MSTLEAAFAHVSVVPSIAAWRESPRMACVVAGSQQPIDLSALSEGFAALDEEILADYVSQRPYVVLTDDYVPVDNLMAPIAEATFEGGAIAR